VYELEQREAVSEADAAEDRDPGSGEVRRQLLQACLEGEDEDLVPDDAGRPRL